MRDEQMDRQTDTTNCTYRTGHAIDQSLSAKLSAVYRDMKHTCSCFER